IQSFPLEIPEGQVHRTHRVQSLAAWRIVVRTIHVLPDAGDLEGVPSNKTGRAGRDRVKRPAFPNPGDPDVRIDGHYHAALQKRDLERHHVGSLVQAYL